MARKYRKKRLSGLAENSFSNTVQSALDDAQKRCKNPSDRLADACRFGASFAVEGLAPLGREIRKVVDQRSLTAEKSAVGRCERMGGKEVVKHCERGVRNVIGFLGAGGRGLAGKRGKRRG